MEEVQMGWKEIGENVTNSRVPFPNLFTMQAPNHSFLGLACTGVGWVSIQRHTAEPHCQCTAAEREVEFRDTKSILAEGRNGSSC